jgi:hypothetical protein
MYMMGTEARYRKRACRIRVNPLSLPRPSCSTPLLGTTDHEFRRESQHSTARPLTSELVDIAAEKANDYRTEQYYNAPSSST